MKSNRFMTQLSTLGRKLTVTLVCLVAIAFVWQSPLVSNISAMAAPAGTLIATADAGNQVKGAAEDIKGASKNIIRGTEDKVKDAARSNASKVDQADETGSAVEGKAKRDRNRIEQKASKDADRTEQAAEKSMNAVERAVDNIKGAFSD
ncbi:hypothetical protein H6F49_14350 [Nodosilinea sp. FACHB-13]|nr:hypothetical protein [Nodosilinea sp. FACHB-13]MBD2108143.1 hypothetical protein [Nodosilinea sp. FACHB-13]